LTPAARRREQAAWLAVLAAFGLAVAPLAHAIEHAHDDEEDTPRALDPLDAIAEAFRHAHEHPAPKHHHSHGPGQSHGDGALAHFAVALHPAPQLALPKPIAPPIAHRVQPSPRRTPDRYLVPRFAQGPPAGRVVTPS
jgi:hypothetical protein